eukprot:c31316_g1_i1 orf=41-469(+)
MHLRMREAKLIFHEGVAFLLRKVHFLCLALSLWLPLIMCSRAVTSGGITVPVFHRANPHIVPGTHLVSRRVFMEEKMSQLAADLPSSSASEWAADALLSSSSSSQMQFPVVTLDEALGEYFAVMEIGTPTQKAAVAIDTGSQ